MRPEDIDTSVPMPRPRRKAIRPSIRWLFVGAGPHQHHRHEAPHRPRPRGQRAIEGNRDDHVDARQGGSATLDLVSARRRRRPRLHALVAAARAQHRPRRTLRSAGRAGSARPQALGPGRRSYARQQRTWPHRSAWRRSWRRRTCPSRSSRPPFVLREPRPSGRTDAAGHGRHGYRRDAADRTTWQPAGCRTAEQLLPLADRRRAYVPLGTRSTATMIGLDQGHEAVRRITGPTLRGPDRRTSWPSMAR